MVSLIKNQLLKHLSIYTKNLSSDKINLSTFRGEGELTNLQLDEVVLTELLELPSWLRITSAWCNHVSFRISWTKLKSVPIVLTLDEVNIAVETCEINENSKTSATTSNINGNGGGAGGGGKGSPGSSNPATPTTISQLPPSKYSFIHKVIDGITIVVNTVYVKFLSPAFTASVQMSRIRVESKTPKWMTGDLRFTRLKDPSRDVILIFKELSWQTVRIEASSRQDKSLTPLRLLTNQSRCRITIRKSMLDNSVLASRLVLILDDLLWVLTDSQLKAALHFVQSLTGLIKEATHATQKTKAARKLTTTTMPPNPVKVAEKQRVGRSPATASNNAIQRMFDAVDVHETSYHFFSQRIDLHFCDDEASGRSSYPDLEKGGALQVCLQAFHVDYYPYHLAQADRLHWAKYKESSSLPALWLKESLNAFRESLLNLSRPNRRKAPTHAPLERTFAQAPVVLNVSTLDNLHDDVMINARQKSSSLGRVGNGVANGVCDKNVQDQSVMENLSKLMSSCVIFRLSDFQLYRITTSGRKQIPKEFISGDKDRYSFPEEIPILHAEFTYFYYPGEFVFPLPPSKIFVHVNPIQINFDIPSILWMHSFTLNLHESMNFTNPSSSPTQLWGGVTRSQCSSSTSSSISISNRTDANSQPTTTKKEENREGEHDHPMMTMDGDDDVKQPPSIMYMDVKLEAIMPRVLIECLPLEVEMPQQKDRPKCMQIQISRLALTNIREVGSSRADLAQAIHSLQEGSLVFGQGFPSNAQDLCIVTDRILSHIAATDNMTIIEDGDSSSSTPNSHFHSHSDATLMLDGVAIPSVSKSVSNDCLTRYAMWSEPRDIWCINLDPIWIDFLGARSLGANKSIPFIDAVPITLWLHTGHNNSNGKSSPRSERHTEKSYHHGNPFVDSEEDMMTHMPRKSQTTPSTSGERNADLHAIVYISNLVSVQLDHYQYLFLLRLAEEFTEMSSFLALDAERIPNKIESKSLILGCVVPQVEVTFIMPSPTPGKESSGGDAESVLPDSASLGDDLHTNHAINTMWQTMKNNNNNNNNTTGGNVELPSPVINEVAPPPMELNLSYSNNTENNIQMPNSSGLQATPTLNSNVKRETKTITSGSQRSSVVMRNSADSTNSITKEINSGFMSMKKGFSSFMTSIDSAINSSRVVAANASASTMDDMSDTFSIQSDLSSDSDNFAISLSDDRTMDCIDIMFKLNPFNTNDPANSKSTPVELATEVCEEIGIKTTNPSSPSEPSEMSNTWRRRDLVSMVTFRLTTVEILRQNNGNDSVLRMQVSAISCDECGAIPWDELQYDLQEKSNQEEEDKTKFGVRCKVWNVANYNEEVSPCIRLRLEQSLRLPSKINNTTNMDKKSVQNWFSQNAEIRASDISLDLNMSTVIGLSDLVEDEILNSVTMPLNITLENIQLNLIEDRPPVNITSPGSVPLNLAFGRLHVKRDKHGIFHIQPIDINSVAFPGCYTSSSFLPNNSATSVVTGQHGYGVGKLERDRERELFSLQMIMQQIKSENENLRRQLNDTKEENDVYRQKTSQEGDKLRSYLQSAQDHIRSLLEEKENLLEVIRTLQLQTKTYNLDNKKTSDANSR